MTETMETLRDIPRLFTALAEWWACLIFIGIIRRRQKKLDTVFISVLALMVQTSFLVGTKNVPLFLWLPCMIAAFLMMILFIRVCCMSSLLVSAYYALIAFLIAEFSASLEWQITQYFLPNAGTEGNLAKVLIMLVTYLVVNGIMYQMLKRTLPKNGKLELTGKDFFSAFLIVASAFAVSNLSFITGDTPFSSQYAMEIANIRTIIDLAGMAMLYAHVLQCGKENTRRELEAVQNVLQNQYQQYKQSRESINLINYKYHDLKHQIGVLREETDPDKRNAFLNKMEEEIRDYELQNKTGNSVLDTVLTGKTLYCAKHGITLTNVADGKLLEFMDTMDICSIFGNALDNAIECELKIPDKEKRLIHVTVSQQKQFLIIRVENYFEGDLKFQEGSLLTTKKEIGFHGYGIKSIRYTANKYEGAVSITAENNWFELKVLIPLPEDGALDLAREGFSLVK